jgi:hypothetical protein
VVVVEVRCARCAGRSSASSRAERARPGGCGAAARACRAGSRRATATPRASRLRHDAAAGPRRLAAQEHTSCSRDCRQARLSAGSAGPSTSSWRRGAGPSRALSFPERAGYGHASWSCRRAAFAASQGSHGPRILRSRRGHLQPPAREGLGDQDLRGHADRRACAAWARRSRWLSDRVPAQAADEVLDEVHFFDPPADRARCCRAGCGTLVDALRPGHGPAAPGADPDAARHPEPSATSRSPRPTTSTTSRTSTTLAPPVPAGGPADDDRPRRQRRRRPAAGASGTRPRPCPSACAARPCSRRCTT